MTIDDLIISENNPDDILGEIEGNEDITTPKEKFNPKLYQNYINRLKDSEEDFINFEELEWIPVEVVSECGGLNFKGKLINGKIEFLIKKDVVDAFLRIMDYMYNR